MYGFDKNPKHSMFVMHYIIFFRQKHGRSRGHTNLYIFLVDAMRNSGADEYLIHCISKAIQSAS